MVPPARPPRGENENMQSKVHIIARYTYGRTTSRGMERHTHWVETDNVEEPGVLYQTGAKHEREA